MRNHSQHHILSHGRRVQIRILPRWKLEFMAQIYGVSCLLRKFIAVKRNPTSLTLFYTILVRYNSKAQCSGLVKEGHSSANTSATAGHFIHFPTHKSKVRLCQLLTYSESIWFDAHSFHFFSRISYQPSSFLSQTFPCYTKDREPNRTKSNRVDRNLRAIHSFIHWGITNQPHLTMPYIKNDTNTAAQNAESTRPSVRKNNFPTISGHLFRSSSTPYPSPIEPVYLSSAIQRGSTDCNCLVESIINEVLSIVDGDTPDGGGGSQTDRN